MKSISLAKLLTLITFISAVSGVAPLHAHASDDWKGQNETSEFSIGALGGVGIVDSHVGFSLLGNVAKKIIPNGFVPDVTNSVWLEAEAGPLFAASATTFAYSIHLRWDFVKDQMWTFYALGGLAGFSEPDSLGGHFELFPRFGVGALWKMFEGFDVRFEVSHELMAVGAQVYF
jgi:hypothetical protein